MNASNDKDDRLYETSKDKIASAMANKILNKNEILRKEGRLDEIKWLWQAFYGQGFKRR